MSIGAFEMFQATFQPKTLKTALKRWESSWRRMQATSHDTSYVNESCTGYRRAYEAELLGLRERHRDCCSGGAWRSAWWRHLEPDREHLTLKFTRDWRRSSVVACLTWVPDLHLTRADSLERLSKFKNKVVRTCAMDNFIVLQNVSAVLWVQSKVKLF